MDESGAGRVRSAHSREAAQGRIGRRHDPLPRTRPSYTPRYEPHKSLIFHPEAQPGKTPCKEVTEPIPHLTSSLSVFHPRHNSWSSFLAADEWTVAFRSPQTVCKVYLRIILYYSKKIVQNCWTETADTQQLRKKIWGLAETSSSNHCKVAWVIERHCVARSCKSR